MIGGGSGGLPARRFADEEVAAILRRASVRELGADLPSPHDPTLSDLMAAAAEVGLDPGEVRRAAAVVSGAGRSVVDVALAVARLEHAGWLRETGGWFEAIDEWADLT